MTPKLVQLAELQRDEARRERDKARSERDDLARRWHELVGMGRLRRVITAWRLK